MFIICWVFVAFSALYTIYTLKPHVNKKILSTILFSANFVHQPFVDCKLSSFHFTAKSILIYVNQEMSREYEGQKFEHENYA